MPALVPPGYPHFTKLPEAVNSLHSAGLKARIGVPHPPVPSTSSVPRQSPQAGQGLIRVLPVAGTVLDFLGEVGADISSSLDVGQLCKILRIAVGGRSVAQ
ncbi:MAG: hypothetical protein O7G86_04615 [Gammaproteobacteria bacterium]|nr:hypothetical protein [Gammaproteobacteria bacterium]